MPQLLSRRSLEEGNHLPGKAEPFRTERGKAAKATPASNSQKTDRQECLSYVISGFGFLSADKYVVRGFVFSSASKE